MTQTAKPKREILDNQTLRSEYHQKVSKALALAKDYQGKQDQSELLLAELDDIEKWLTEKFGVQHELGGLPPGFERQVLAEWCDEVERNRSGIDDLLGISSEAHKQFLESVLCGLIEGVCMVELEAVVLPPGEGPGILEGEGESPMEEPVFQERVRDLLIALEQAGIYSDDVILIQGKLTGHEMRKLSYVIIEIPKLGREILVNNQVGEATFVIDGIMSRQYLATVSKKELQENYPEHVLRVVYLNKGHWLGEIMGFLLKDVQDAKKLEKFDVSLQEKIRKEICLSFTPKSWSELEKSKKKEIKVCGNKGLESIATLFGLKENPLENHNNHLALGRLLFGEEHECLWEFNQENVRKILTERYSAEEWSKLTVQEKSKIKVSGIKGLDAVATLFGLKKEDNPISNHNVHLALGRKLFGEEHECLWEFNQENVKKILTKRYSAEEWSKLKKRDKQSIKVCGNNGLLAIAHLFGLEDDPISNHNVHLALGRKLFGEEHECLWEFNQENVRKILTKKYTPQQWSELTAEEKRGIKVCNNGLKSIATLFGLKKGDNPISNHNVHLALGRKLFGEEHECLKEFTKEEAKTEILVRYPTAQDWINMNFKEKENFEIKGRGLVAIAALFGLKKLRPIENKRDFLALGRAIYGEDVECLQYPKK